MNFHSFEEADLLINILQLKINSWKLLTLAGYRNSFTNPKSSPVANTLLSLVRHEAVTSVTSPIMGQIPSQQEPKTLVHDAQPIFSTYKNNPFETEHTSSPAFFFHIWFLEKVLTLSERKYFNILITYFLNIQDFIWDL